MSRPESRQSDVRDARGKPGKDRSFEAGDAVRIESLGMEGTLHYLGAIDGKPGMWAGVELAPGFAGRGKNDGTVNGSVLLTALIVCIFLKLAVNVCSCSPAYRISVALRNAESS